jgi:hypothetical protein
MIKEEIMMSILDLLNAICKIAFIVYVWITMIRVNVYITKQEREDK